MRAARRTVTLLAAGALLLAACTDDEPDEEPDDPPTEDTEPQATPTFARVEVEGLSSQVGEVELHDVHGDDDGWTVVGAVTEPGQQPRTTVLVSADGEEFEALPLPEPDTERHRASALTRAGGSTIVAGSAGDEDGTHLVVWTQDEDGDWELTELDDELGTWAGLAANNATAAGDRAVVVGTVREQDEEREPKVWLVTDDGGATGVDLGIDEGFLRDVAGTDEELLAVGGGQDEVLLLRSTDQGEDWEPVEPEGLDGAEVHVLEVDGDGWLAGGSVDGGEGGGRAAIFSSPDGESWELLNDPERAGASSVRAVHRLDGRLVALGTWLHVEADEEDDDGGMDIFEATDDGWEEPTWPGPGERGWFGVGAEHDGRVVAVGGVADAATSLRTATDPDEWDVLPVAEQVLERAEGVLSRWVASLASDGDTVVGVGGQVSLADDVAVRRIFAGVAPGFEPAEAPARGPGQLASVAHTAQHGFVAVGSTASDEFDHAGVRALVSEDGREWTELDVDEDGDDDRAQVVLPLADRVLVAGLSWDDQEPVSYLWEVADDELERLEVPELDGFGVVEGCAGGDVVALVVFPGDETRLLAVSQDGGENFELVGEDPLLAAGRLLCAANDAGELLVAALGETAAGLYHFDTEGAFDQVDIEFGDQAAVSGVLYLPEVGWVVLSDDVEEGARQGRVRLSRDLEEWTSAPVETDADSTALGDAVVADGSLHLFGTEDDAAAMWRLDLGDLPR